MDVNETVLVHVELVKLGLGLGSSFSVILIRGKFTDKLLLGQLAITVLVKDPQLILCVNFENLFIPSWKEEVIQLVLIQQTITVAICSKKFPMHVVLLRLSFLRSVFLVDSHASLELIPRNLAILVSVPLLKILLSGNGHVLFVLLHGMVHKLTVGDLSIVVTIDSLGEHCKEILLRGRLGTHVLLITVLQPFLIPKDVSVLFHIPTVILPLKIILSCSLPDSCNQHEKRQFHDSKIDKQSDLSQNGYG
mmetsp:Transcript_41910/g.100718  ORF Transcript_41910/g.100718 Transcript_41910/m.100718 type:complete len:249 (-) Transcript_41910:8-754(-)